MIQTRSSLPQLPCGRTTVPCSNPRAHRAPTRHTQQTTQITSKVAAGYTPCCSTSSPPAHILTLTNSSQRRHQGLQQNQRPSRRKFARVCLNIVERFRHIPFSRRMLSPYSCPFQVHREVSSPHVFSESAGCRLGPSTSISKISSVYLDVTASYEQFTTPVQWCENEKKVAVLRMCFGHYYLLNLQ